MFFQVDKPGSIASNFMRLKPLSGWVLAMFLCMVELVNEIKTNKMPRAIFCFHKCLKST